VTTGVEHHGQPVNAGYHPAFSSRIPSIWREFPMVNVSKEGQVFKCEICGNIVIVKEAGGGELICCGEPMQLVE
jgi:desulfoferrodoxin-like iron-binding protein